MNNYVKWQCQNFKLTEGLRIFSLVSLFCYYVCMGMSNIDRYIVLDTETTGLSTKDNHRIVEIGCVELLQLKPTFKTFHTYINPERDMSPGAQSVHGLSTKFLSDFKNFAQISEEFLDFVGDSTFIIHNAKFDMGFLNHELKLLGKKPLENNVIDTLQMAKKLYPGTRVNLDALCKNFNVCLDERGQKGHGALLDAKLLTEVYLQMVSKREENDVFSVKAKDSKIVSVNFDNMVKVELTEEELFSHENFVKEL